ncbi:MULTISPECIES: SRPBCC family protein [unclassified Luteococcus]|uniref:SRPBCC family protein n=1 Tax=unclassified Luteococcus TaxID=2639923 RepID=UPI00313E52AF
MPGLMTYTCRVEIAAPRARVLELMTDGDRAAEWMPGLVSYRAIEGERGTPGSVSELRFDGVPGPGEMIEKVERRDAEHHDVVYLLGPVRNVVHNTFVELPDGGTRWAAEHIFHLPPGMLEGIGEQGQAAFRQNTQGSMETFKTWCEANA